MQLMADRRVASIPALQQRPSGLSGRPRATHRVGVSIEALLFIEKKTRCALRRLAVSKMLGKTLLFQSAMAFSFRSRARRRGFCGVHFSRCRRNRPT